MRIAGYTEAEHDRIDKIDTTNDPNKKESAIALFEKETGKSFPTVRFERSPSAMSRTRSDTFSKGISGGCLEYQPWARKF